MSDLISRRAAIKAIEDLQDCYNGFSDTYDKACIIGVIEEVPPIEPVRHGRWLPSNKGDCTYTCSECGFVRDAYILEDKAYCPRCGAKMFDKDIDVPDKNVGKMDEVENDKENI